MSTDGDDARLQAVLRSNAALTEQVQQLVRAERKIDLSRRELARQLGRVDALNRFAVDVAELSSPAEILVRAADVLFELFPFDQYVGFLAGDGGGFVPAAIRAEPGRAARSAEALAAVQQTEVSVQVGRAPLVSRAAEIHARHGEGALLACLERIFREGDATEGAEPRAWIVVVPIVRRGEPADAVMIFRRLEGVLSAQDELPTVEDLAFLGLVAQQVAGALTKGRLLHDLRVSYARLADAQRELVERERLAALGELAAVVAHEVRNPLGAIFNAVSMLGRLVPREGDAPGLLDIVREESERLNQIVSDLIDFARPHSLMPREESIVSIAEGAVVSVRVRFPDTVISLVVEDPAPPLVWVDVRMIRQALINLLVNAVQACREGAEVLVRISAMHDGRVRVAVADQGTGVPEHVAARIFEPFFTTKPTGTGLGLSVVKRVVEAHDATIELSTCVDIGSTFAIVLPIDREVRRGRRSGPDARANAPDGGRAV